MRLFNAVLKHSETKSIEGAHYFLLKLLPKENRIVIEGFKSADLASAQERYREVEREISAAAGDDVVLVSTSSMSALRRAYPNYFLDTRAFMIAVNEALKDEPTVVKEAALS